MEVIQALAERPQWILWRWETDANGRQTKVPYCWHGNSKASSMDAGTWTTVQQAHANVDLADGLGFVFSRDDDFCGIDLDGCRNPKTGEIDDWARRIIDQAGSYSEVSPSGNGVKIFCRGKLPESCKHKRKLELPNLWGKQPEIEVYDRGRFFCYTGQPIPDSLLVLSPAQGLLDQLIEVRKPRRMPDFTVARPAGADIVKRATTYVDKIPRTQCGTASCHDRTFQVACNLAVGFGLSDAQAFEILNWWQAQGTHEWQERELRHKIESARDHAQDQPGYLADDRAEWEKAAADLPPVDVSRIVAMGDESESEEPDAEFPIDALPPGFIERVYHWNLRTAFYPQPILAFGGAVALLATLTGRRICDSYGTRTNTYILALAPSGAGKEHARKINKSALGSEDASGMIGNERIGSHAGLIAELVENPSCLFQLDEFGRFLATSKDARINHLFAIGTVLMELYSSSDTRWVGDAYADRSKRRVIHCPNPVVYGTSVPKIVWDNLTTNNITDGLIGRMMIFEADGYVELQEPERLGEVPKEIKEDVDHWATLLGNIENREAPPKEPRVFTHAPDARERYLGHLKAISGKRKGEDEAEAAIWSRSGEKAAKLALIFAASRQGAEYHGGYEIAIEDMDRAIRVSNWMTRHLIQRAKDNIAASIHEEILNRVRQALKGRWRTKREVSQATRWLNKKTRDEVLNQLNDEGWIEVKKEQTSHKETTYYRSRNKVKIDDE